MSNSPVCWHCGASLAALTPPISRFDVCRSCGAAVHVCRQCRLHDASVAKQCREPIAEEVRDKTRANVCDYFSLKPDAFQAAPDVSEQRAQLAALFGGTPSKTAGSQTSVADTAHDPAQAARQALDALFKK